MNMTYIWVCILTLYSGSFNVTFSWQNHLVHDSYSILKGFIIALPLVFLYVFKLLHGYLFLSIQWFKKNWAFTQKMSEEKNFISDLLKLHFSLSHWFRSQTPPMLPFPIKHVWKVNVTSRDFFFRATRAWTIALACWSLSDGFSPWVSPQGGVYFDDPSNCDCCILTLYSNSSYVTFSYQVQL